jgi:hypothetical protein
VYSPEGKVIRDPDEQVRRSIAAVFEAFRRTGSASATVKYFKEHGLQSPSRLRNGAQKGEVQWIPLVHSKVIRMLHNVRYAGAFFYGRMKSWKLPDGRTRYKILPQDQWHTLIKDAHEGYVSWPEYESNQRRRYIQVDPENRLVADTLEAEWNEKLRMLNDAQEEYERQRKKDLKVIGVEEREKILALATDFPRLWNDAGTQCREKKRMLRLLIEDVTLTRNTDRTIGVDIRFKGGAYKSLHLPAPVLAWELNRTSKALIDRIDSLLNEHTDAEIADILNSEGKTSATGMRFDPVVVGTIRRRAGLKSRYERLREQNLLTLCEIATKLNISTKTVREWAEAGIIKTYRFNDRNSCLYEFDGETLISNLHESGQKGRRNQAFVAKVNERINEVQYEV